ncbi:MAG: ATP-binding protein [Lachnospiraceae bacterium]|nr:ATP-binding protein [Lachnospiraceae bacterium]
MGALPEKKKKLPVGIDNFQKLRTEQFYYVDKTLMIRDLLNAWGEVNLFTRPRRFGKSLNMSMLKAFFEIDCDKAIFKGLAISEETALCEKYMGKYPVISITLKSVSGSDFSIAVSLMRSVIRNEALRFDFLAKSDVLSAEEKDAYRQLISFDRENQISVTDLMGSLKLLSDLLYKYYGRKVIILIDEYDVPLAKASTRGYYAQMVDLIRGMFDQALKTNNSLYFAVMTGCIRVAKESIFTGLNNPKMYTLLDAECDEQFGFTDKEVRQMLDYYDLAEYYEVMREWYDGYKIGHANVYNPWDVINWCNQLLTNPDKTPKSYWVNSSGNDEVKSFIRRMGDGVTKAQIERLVAGETVRKKIEEQLTYNTLYDSIDNMWSLLFATGYLTQSETPIGNMVQLMIPNAEVRYIFSDYILDLFGKEVAEDGAAVSDFCVALKNGDASDVERRFTQFMEKTISIRDSSVKKEFKENFYHGLLLGIIGFKNDWDVDSNREAGAGYYDIKIEIEDEEIGIIIEVKYAENEKFDRACEEAMKQINNNDYAAELRKDDMQTILKYGIACYKKKCKVVVEQENTCLSLH